jgi:hypothetical protein
MEKNPTERTNARLNSNNMQHSKKQKSRQDKQRKRLSSGRAEQQQQGRGDRLCAKNGTMGRDY